MATSTAQSAIEHLRSSGVLASSHTELDDPLLPSGALDVATSTYNASLGLTRVRVEVSWQGQNGQTESVVLVTVVSRRMRHLGG